MFNWPLGTDVLHAKTVLIMAQRAIDMKAVSTLHFWIHRYETAVSSLEVGQRLRQDLRKHARQAAPPSEFTVRWTEMITHASMFRRQWRQVVMGVELLLVLCWILLLLQLPSLSRQSLRPRIAVDLGSPRDDPRGLSQVGRRHLVQHRLVLVQRW